MSDKESRKEKSLKKLEKGLKNLSSEEISRIRNLIKDKDHKSENHDSEKVDWIYKESKPDEEDYLLGRRVDRFVEQSSSREVAVKDIPGSTFKVEDDELIAKRADLDMQAKMREDPLFAIRKKEEEAKRRLLENPVKMKQLQKIISIREMEKKKKKKDKKHKKQKKHKKRDSSSDSDDDNDDLVNKYLQILSKKHRLDDPEVKERLKKSFDEEATEEGRGARNRRQSTDEEEEERHTDRRRGDIEEDEPRKQYGLVMSNRYKSQMKTNKSDQRRSRSPRRSRSRSPRSSKTKSSRRSRSPKKTRSPRRSRSPAYQRKSPSPPRYKAQSSRSKDIPKKKLSAEDKERLRREMMSDARARDEQREANVKRYREEDQREKESYRKQGGATFISSMMTEHVTKSSVEDRIKRNKYNVQRTKAALENSFRKK